MTSSLLRAIVILSCVACAAEHKPAWEAPVLSASCGSARASESDYRQLIAQGDAAWAERGDKDQLMRAIYAWESAARIQPGDFQTWTKLARASYLFADAFLNPAVIPDADKIKYQEAHERGVRYGELALSSYSTEFKARVQAGASVEDAAMRIDRGGVGALYWYAANLSRWADAKGFSTRMAQRDRIARVVTRCLELDPGYFYAAPHRGLAVLLSWTPGADLERARQHFDAAVRAAPQFLETHVLYAEHYAAKRGDRELYRHQLEVVLAAPDTALPDVIPEQRIEKARARRLLDQLQDRF